MNGYGMSKGYRLQDSTGFTYPGVVDNGNFWVGAEQLRTKHHTGQTFISAGYNADNSKGNTTVFVAVPSDDNTTASSYPVYHTNNRPYHYGVCNTEANVAAKAVTTSVGGPGFALSSGQLVFIKFLYSNTAANPTLNIDDTGAKSIRRYGTTSPGTAASTSWNAGSVVALMYDGSQFQMLNWLNTDSDTTYELATTSAPGLMSAADKTKVNNAVTVTSAVDLTKTNSGKLWTSSTNKIAIAVNQVEDGKTYALLAKSNYLQIMSADADWTNQTPVYNLYPTTGTAPISVTNGAVSHANSGVTAGTIGTNSTTALTPAFGGTFSVPGFAVNATGHVTSATSHTVKMPNSLASSTASGLMSATNFNRVSQLVYWGDEGTRINLYGFYAGILTDTSHDIVFWIPTSINPTGKFASYREGGSRYGISLSDTTNFSVCKCRGAAGALYPNNNPSDYDAYDLCKYSSSYAPKFYITGSNAYQGIMCMLELPSNRQWYNYDKTVSTNNTAVTVELQASLVI